MKVLIVSDTHGRDENLEIAVNREAPFDMLVHCGDVEAENFISKPSQTVPAALYPEIMIFSPIFQEKM